MHHTIKQVSRDMEGNFQFNTAISRVMELVNEIYKQTQDTRHKTQDKILREAVETVFLLLAPLTPHICEEAWKILGNKDSIFRHSWPEYKKEFLKEDEIELAVVIKGKVKGRFKVSSGATVQEIEKKALGLERVKESLKGSAPKKVIYVPGKLVNIVC